jgi:uncharacterized membrane protein
MADEERADEQDDGDAEGQEGSDDASESSGSSGQKRGLLDTLMSQAAEHKEVLAPVATSAAAAAATYAAKKLPELISSIEDGGGDKLRSKLEEASDAGGIKGFMSGAASRAFSNGGGGGLLERLVGGGEQEAESKAKGRGGIAGAAASVAQKATGTGSGSSGGYGWGKGRRLPIMRSIDVAAPIATVYDQWTQFEEMSNFMHRVEAVDQKDPETLEWHENIWGRRRDWNVQITEQVPNERIAWKLKGGGQGSGVITFHELAPNLTRIELLFDWQPSGFVEKIASGLRVHKRAARTDLGRFKAFVMTQGEATGGWRGRIEDGDVKRQTRNKRNTKSDPIPSEARQHSGDEKDDGNGSGEARRGGSGAAARDERRRHREERASQRKEKA